jgi:hypothetical protein
MSTIFTTSGKARGWRGEWCEKNTQGWALSKGTCLTRTRTCTCARTHARTHARTCVHTPSPPPLPPCTPPSHTYTHTHTSVRGTPSHPRRNRWSSSRTGTPRCGRCRGHGPSCHPCNSFLAKWGVGRSWVFAVGGACKAASHVRAAHHGWRAQPSKVRGIARGRPLVLVAVLQVHTACVPHCHAISREAINHATAARRTYQ